MEICKLDASIATWRHEALDRLRRCRRGDTEICSSGGGNGSPLLLLLEGVQTSRTVWMKGFGEMHVEYLYVPIPSTFQNRHYHPYT